MIFIKEIENKKIWEDFVLAQPVNSFFQSWAWGEIQIKVQSSLRPELRARAKLKVKNLWRLGIYDNDDLVGVGQVVKVTARRGSFLHLRHGPILKEWQRRYFEPFLEKIKEIALAQRVWFVRMSPLIDNGEENKKFFKDYGLVTTVIPRLDASTAWLLDLKPSTEEILAQMRKTTRYLIKKAAKMGLEVIEGKREEDFQKFINIYKQTAQRQGFVVHQEIRPEWEIFRQENLIKLYLAKFCRKIYAAALIVFYGHQAVYHHSGALIDKDIPAMPAILWAAIQEAKKLGKQVFNFWGIAPPGREKDPWQGLTLFKTGFGGEAKEYLPAQDLPLSPFYWLTFMVETFRRLKRGY